MSKFEILHLWTTDEIQASIHPEKRGWDSAWNRATDVVYDMYATFAYPVSAHNDIEDPGYIEVGRWTTYRFEIDRTEINHQIKHLKLGLQDLSIDVIELPNLEVITGSDTMWTYLDRPWIKSRPAHNHLGLRAGCILSTCSHRHEGRLVIEDIYLPTTVF